MIVSTLLQTYFVGQKIVKNADKFFILRIES